jgi:hypothetical protein
MNSGELIMDSGERQRDGEQIVDSGQVGMQGAEN